ncbi:MAG: putative metal-binding motif-containing protein [Deltaproteobacteria bacterium]|nr:putative metal-binding motif-containing protein [Deltaproteobacteria bacterium]
MRAAVTALSIFLVATLGCGCSLALDFDELNKGTPAPDASDSDTGPCAKDADCDDGFACTADSCNGNGACEHLPDNSKCKYLEYCDRDEGCKATGDECKVAADCDDGIECTKDDCALGKCRNLPDDAVCKGTNPCILDQVCNPEVGCNPGYEKPCEPTDLPCRENMCDPSTGECAIAFVDGADDDADSALDSACGGDDCNDGNPDVHPGAPEICNGVDDDCDGVTDATLFAGPLDVATGADLSAARLAFDGSAYAVVWQDGSDAAAKVKARVAGLDGALLTDEGDFTAKGGTGGAGETPDVAAGNGSFLGAWVARPTSGAPQVRLVGFTANTGKGSVAFDASAVALATGGATQVASPRVIHDASGSGWVVAWSAEGDGGTAVALESEDMHSHPDPSFAVSTGTGAVSGVALALVGPNEYAVAFARDDAASGSEPEVYESLVSLATGEWVNTAGWPKRVSLAGGSVGDPSRDPCVAADGTGAWVTAFSDKAGDGDDDFDIRASFGGTLYDLIESDGPDEVAPDLAFSGPGLGLLFTREVSSAEALEFRLFDTSLAPVPDQSTRLVTLPNGEVRGSRLVSAGSGFAAVWVEKTSASATVKLASFGSCTPSSK